MDNKAVAHLDENQWFDDPYYTLVIKFPNPQPGFKAEYKVQPFMFQLKSGYYNKKLDEATVVPFILTLPNSFSHQAYELIHREILGSLLYYV